MSRIGYRPDIDGLRALAVSAVVIYHAGASWLPGGYVGVDVFFVISGYLITSILKEEVDAGRINILNFYERRARRILPALLTMFALTSVAALLVLTPHDLRDLGKQVLSSIAFISNFKFWRGSDYWSSELLPMLHTWSLSIEEQFYVVFPILLFILSGLGQKRRASALIMVASFSFVLSVLAVPYEPSAAFFLLPTRAWELLIGALLALGVAPPLLKDARYREVAGLAGAAAILTSCFLYSEDTPFPGVAAVAPCLGAALIIQSGQHGTHVVGRFLSIRPVVLLGLVSYSLYLYHFPIIVFLKAIAGRSELSSGLALLAVLSSLGLAIISWRYVELPFRDRARVSAATLLKSTAAGVALIGTFCIGAIASGGFPQRFTPFEQRLLAGQDDFSERWQDCVDYPLAAVLTEATCALNAASTHRTTFVILGDSHAAALAPAMDIVAKRSRRKGIVVAGGSCPPLLGMDLEHLSERAKAACETRLEAALTNIRGDPAIDTVVLVAHWPGYVVGPDHTKHVSAALLRAVSALNGKRIVLIYGLPTTEVDLPRSLALAGRMRNAPQLRFPGTRPFAEAMEQLDRRGVRLISLTPAVCPEPRTCLSAPHGKPILRDTNHLTTSAAETLVAPYLLEALSQTTDPTGGLF